MLREMEARGDERLRVWSPDETAGSEGSFAGNDRGSLEGGWVACFGSMDCCPASGLLPASTGAYAGPHRPTSRRSNREEDLSACPCHAARRIEREMGMSGSVVGAIPG